MSPERTEIPLGGAIVTEQRPPAPTRCPHCEFMPLTTVTVCKNCGKDYLEPVRPGDRVACAASLFILALLGVLA